MFWNLNYVVINLGRNVSLRHVDSSETDFLSMRVWSIDNSNSSIIELLLQVLNFLIPDVLILAYRLNFVQI